LGPLKFAMFAKVWPDAATTLAAQRIGRTKAVLHSPIFLTWRMLGARLASVIQRLRRRNCWLRDPRGYHGNAAREHYLRSHDKRSSFGLDNYCRKSCHYTQVPRAQGKMGVVAILRQRSGRRSVPTHALPANSLFSVDTFTFSPSLMKRGTRISRPVSSLAVLVPPPEESPRIAGSV